MLWCRGSGIASKARGIRAVAWASIPKLLKVKSVVQASEASRPDGKAILQGRRAQAQHYAMQRLLAIALRGTCVCPATFDPIRPIAIIRLTSPHFVETQCLLTV